MLEINHDHTPRNDDATLLAWAKAMKAYLGSGDPKLLPRGVTYFGMRHHTAECPLGNPPRGWDNEKPRRL